MTPDQFARNLQTFGADLERWPEKGRRDAEAVLAKSAAFRDAREKAGRLDRLLRLDRESAIEASRLRSITDVTLRGIRWQDPVVPIWHWLLTKPVGAAFASAAVAGLLAVYVVGPVLDPPRPQGVSVVGFMLGGGIRGSDEFF